MSHHPPHTQDPTPTPQSEPATPPPYSPEPGGREQSAPPVLDGLHPSSKETQSRLLAQQRLQRRSFGRWLVMAPMRLLYRFWTRLAAHLFPEDTQRAHFAEQLGLSLPDRLDLSWVTSSLAVGGRIRPDDIPLLARKGVTRVVDTRAEYHDDENALNREGIQLLYLPTPDTHPLTLDQLLEGAEWVLRQMNTGQKVLIHCEHGVGRSVLLTCAALVRAGYSAEQALLLVQSKRWQASPNHRQITRLHEFEEFIQADAQNQPDQAGEQPEHAV